MARPKPRATLPDEGHFTVSVLTHEPVHFGVWIFKGLMLGVFFQGERERDEGNFDLLKHGALSLTGLAVVYLVAWGREVRGR